MQQKVLITLVTLGLIAVVLFVVFQDSAVAPEVDITPSSSPLVSPTASASSTPTTANITVTSPKAGDTVSNPITVTGRARVFENTFNYILRDANGKKLFESYGMTNAQDAGLFGSYTMKIPVPAGATQNLVVEVFEYSAKDGSVINLVRVPVKLASTQTSTVKVALQKDVGNDCGSVVFVQRTILQTNEPAYASLFELLKGLTSTEVSASYITNIPANVRINSVIIRSQTAYVDFDEALQQNVAGSCRVTAIRAQITQTLKQFSSIKDVVISINGRTDDILQP